jgi:hypothetical protein
MMFNSASPASPRGATAVTRPNPLVPLHRVVDDDARLRAWNERRMQEAALLRLVRRGLPRPVAERVHVADGSKTTLELSTSAGAIASILRQHGPQILAALRHEGWQFNGITVRVQPQVMPVSSGKSQPRQWDSSSRQPMDALCQRLPPGPLKAALRRFLRNR